jgi:hypothetical protein
MPQPIFGNSFAPSVLGRQAAATPPTPTVTPASPPPATPAGVPAQQTQPKMTYQQFGDTIKQKYPAYQDQNSAVLAQHILAKYPQYQSQVIGNHDISQGVVSAVLGQTGLAKLDQPAYSMGADNKSGLIGTVAKEGANIGKSLGKFAVGVGQFLDPITTAQKIGQIPGAIAGYAKDLSGAQQSAQQASQTLAKAQASDIAHGKAPIKPLAQSPSTSSLTPDFAKAAWQTIAPPDVQKLAQGKVTDALQSTAEDPYQLAPAFLMLKGVLDTPTGTDVVDEKSGDVKPGTIGDTKIGSAIDKTISKTAAPIIKAGEYVSGKIGDFAKTVAKFGTSQATGLSPKTITTILDNPEKFFGKDYSSDFTREALADKVKTAIDSRISDLSETGKEYQAIRKSDETVSVPMAKSGIPAPVQAMLDKFGITLGEDKEGNPAIETTAESVPMSKSDISALQDFLDKFGDKDELSANAFLNARKALSNMSSYDAAKTDAADAMARQLRTEYDKLGKTQLTGLQALDEAYAPETKLLQQIKKDYLNPDGSFKDTAISKLANLTNAGRESVLARLEQIVPGISKEITVLKAVEDIAAAGGQKVGTYSRAALSGGGAVAAVATGNIPLLAGAITEAILSNPTVATQILAGWGKMMGVDVSGTLNKVFNTDIPGTPKVPTAEDSIGGPPPPKGEGETPSTTTLKGLAKDAKDNGGITVDYNGNKVTTGYAFSTLDKANETALTMDENFDSIFVDKFNEFKAKYGADSTNNFGGWVQDGKFIVDNSYVSQDLTQSLYDAILKKQDAVGDLAKYASGQDGTIYITKENIASLQPLGRGSFESSQSPFRDWQEAVDYYTGKDFKNAQDIQTPSQGGQTSVSPVQSTQPQGAPAEPGVAGSQAQNPPVGDVSGGRLLPSVENQAGPENIIRGGPQSDSIRLVQKQQYTTSNSGLGSEEFPVPERGFPDYHADDLNSQLEKVYNQSHLDAKISKSSVGSYLDNITPILKNSGIPDATLKNIQDVFNALPDNVLGRFEGIKFDSSPGTVGALGLRVGGGWGLELNRAYYDHPLYQEGKIINHELGGHLTYAMAPQAVKSAINDSALQLADADPKSIEEIWGQNLPDGVPGAIKNMKNYYTSETQRVYDMMRRSGVDGTNVLEETKLTDSVGTALPPEAVSDLMNGAKQVVYDWMKKNQPDILKENSQLQTYFKNGNHMMADEFRARLMESANTNLLDSLPADTQAIIKASPMAQDLENIKSNFQGILKRVGTSKNLSAAKLFAKAPPTQ